MFCNTRQMNERRVDGLANWESGGKECFIPSAAVMRIDEKGLPFRKPFV